MKGPCEKHAKLILCMCFFDCARVMTQLLELLDVGWEVEAPGKVSPQF